MIDIPIMSHVLSFRRLAWEEEIASTPLHKEPRRAYLIQALSKVNGQDLSIEKATEIINTLRRPVFDRVYTIYMGSLPARRKFSSETPYTAPTAREYIARLESEDEKRERDVDAAMRDKFSEEELEEAQDISDKIVKGTGLKGAVKINPFTGETIGPADSQ